MINTNSLYELSELESMNKEISYLITFYSRGDRYNPVTKLFNLTQYKTLKNIKETLRANAYVIKTIKRC